MSGQATKNTDLFMEEKAIVSYLKNHPDFFHRHIDLLEILKVPHPSGVAVSLVERQIDLLRKKNNVLEKQLNTLIKAANNSENVVKRLHHLALELINSDSLNSAVASCQDILCNEFNADHVVLRLIGDGKDSKGLHFIKPNHPSLKHFDSLFKKQEAICGKLRPKQQLFLFGDQGVSIRSAVLIPLYETKAIGVLALGSCDEHRFNPSMGTLFINYLGELISRALVKYLD